MHSFLKMGAVLATLLHTIYGQTPVGQIGAPVWLAFNSSIGGRLGVGVPWSEPCFSNFNGLNNTPNATECSFVQANYFNSHLARTDFFGAYSAIQFESCMSTGDQCMLDWTNPTNPAAFSPPATCKQGSVPSFYVDVKSANDVVEAYNFAKNTGITLLVRNTGHDFKGRSAAPNSLALWTHHLKDISFVEKFVPTGCHTPGVTAITMAAGIQFADLVPFADSHGVEVVVGSDQAVGVTGGFLQGGGHSSISPSLGLGADRVLQYTVVTPDGSTRIANACQNSDLFFALRGGGGGTFGVVMDATILATPRRTYQVASINWPINNDNLEKMLTMFVDNATALATQSWGGYFTASTGVLALTNPLLTTQQAQQALTPLMDLAISLGGTASITTLGSFAQWFNEFVGNQLDVQQDSVGLPNALTSRLIPEANHRTAAGRAQLVTALLNAFNSTVFSQIHMTTPFGFNGTNGSDTSVNPVWRTSLYQVILVNTWFFNSQLADRKAAYAASTTAANFLRDITPNSGAYQNEADIHEPNFEQAFWGTSLYNKLLAIKNKYDPKRIFDCWQCIGWKGPSAPQYTCYI